LYAQQAEVDLLDEIRNVLLGMAQLFG
jgi:hypothetical protein